ncbi:MAG: metallophosphoesterase family protein [Acidimicrobiia bacterium]
MRIVVVSDTHVRDRALSDESSLGLPAAAVDAIDGADLVLHCGDVVEPELLARLGARKPFHAVLGNNDAALRGALPERLLVEADGVRIGMVHDSGPTKGRAARVHRMFPDADVVVFGHSHMPVNEMGVDGQWLLNPGSPTQRRRSPAHTVGVIETRDGAFWNAEIVEV